MLVWKHQVIALFSLCSDDVVNFDVFLQGPEHPNPGKPFTARGFPRHCYLPDSEKGRKVNERTLPLYDLMWSVWRFCDRKSSLNEFLHPGSEAAPGSMGPPAHFLCGHVQHHRGIRHGHLERGSPQDRVWLQPDRPWLPWPWPPRQCPGRAESSGHHRGGVSTQRLNRRQTAHCKRCEKPVRW